MKDTVQGQGLISGSEFLRFSMSTNSHLCPYNYRLSGQRGKEEWGVSMTREGARALAMMILDKL